MKRMSSVLLEASVRLALSSLPGSATVIGGYMQTNLVSDLPILGTVTDPNLKNPWGVSESAMSPLWVSDQAAGVATLYTIHGVTATPAGGPLVVTIPTTATGPQGPTGQVSNPFNTPTNTAFEISSNTPPSPTPAHFIFANLNGTISAWANSMTPAAIKATVPGVLTGLAISSVNSTPYLYAADESKPGSIQVFDGNFMNVTNSTFLGKFVDPSLPAGLVPFNVQNIGGTIYVTYAEPTNGADRTPQTMAPAGTGAVAEFDANGNFIKQLISGSELASPWGIALAPAGFGTYGGDLVVGNFSYMDGQINVFDPNTGAFIVTLDDVKTAWQGLWALQFGNGGSGGDPNILYFTTGLNAETDGLLAAVSFVPEPSGLGILATALAALFGLRRARYRK